MSNLRIVKVNSLPVTPDPNTMYLVPVTGSADLFDTYLTNTDGTVVRHIATQDETLASTVLYGPTPPPLPNKTKLWWDTTSGALHIQYSSGENYAWVEAMPSIAVPEFAGTGSASTMARSDHDHDEVYVQIGANEW